MTEPELLGWLHAKLPEDAYSFLRSVTRIARMADDLADGDVPPAERPHVMGQLAYVFLLELPASDFFVRHQGSLAPLLATCFTTWAHTDEAKLSASEPTRMWGYVWRDSIDFMLYQTALLACGPIGARAIIAEWLILEHGDTSESFTEWEQSSDGPLRQTPEGS